MSWATILSWAKPKARGGAYEAVGIESPGLSAAPAIAQTLAEMIVSAYGLAPKAVWKPAPERMKPFNEMTDAERQQACALNPANGCLVCRCERGD